MIKQHIPVGRYDSFSTCFPLFRPLALHEKEAVTKGSAFFQQTYQGVRLFPDPFLDVPRALPTALLKELRISIPADPFLQSVAAKISSEIKSRWGIKVSTVTDDHPERLIQSEGPLLLLGGSDRNRGSMEISKKYQIGPFSSECPGKGGWGLTTHRELEAGMALRYILACDEATSQDAISELLTQAIDASTSTPALKWVHRVSPGPELKKALPDFDSWIADSRKAFGSTLRSFPRLQTWFTSRGTTPYRQVFKETMAHDLVQDYWNHGVMPHSGRFLDLGMRALHYYQWTGEEKTLTLFREMMWGLSDYLNSENPQVYISDMDFRLGLLCNDWNWIEHSPTISPEERKLFTHSLLGSIRMVHGYFEQRWKNTPPAAFNHRTFKARTLILAWRYFKRWDLPDLQEWKKDAAFIFNKIDFTASKFHEDAATYETFVPEHTLVWLETTGEAVPEGMQQALAWFAKRSWAMTDNFFHSVDFGDSDPRMSRSRPFEVAPWLSENTAEQGEIKAVESSNAGIFPATIPYTPFRNFAGLYHGVPEKPFPSDFLNGWTRIPLDPSFATYYQAAGMAENQFDKLAWRSGWMPGSAYLAVGGIGKGAQKPFVSHAHHEANSILRMNLGGRVWVVNNGYGKSNQALPSSILYRTRQIGPEDHNTLIVRDPSSGAAISPPMNALLKDNGEEPIPFSVTELTDYGGVNWQRNFFVLPEIGFLVIDHVLGAGGKSALPPLELQWNLLGKRSGDEDQSRLEQNGVTLEFKHLGSATAAWKESDIAAWRELIQSGAYGHSDAMPSQCILTPHLKGSQSTRFMNGFWLADSVTSAQWEEKARTLRVTTRTPLPHDGTLERLWGTIASKGNSLTITFNP